jgi:EAL domain-containing protein (putative c-di-GMP-specific phosphodiesterase class I)
MRSDHPTTVAHLIAGDALRAVFQPIVRFAEGEILGYEALIRGPVGSALESPLSGQQGVAGRIKPLSIE